MAAPPTPPRAQRRWSIGKKISATLGLGLLAGVLWLFLSPDEPPPDVRDLLVERLKLPVDQNAYALIKQAEAVALKNVKADLFNDGNDDARRISRDMLTGKNWDPALAHQWLAGTEAVWPIWEQAARTPQSQVPRDANLRLPEQPPLDQLAQIRAWDLARGGKPETAMTFLFTTLEVGQHLQHSRGSLLTYHWGWTIKWMTLASLRGIAVEFKPPAALLRQALQLLEANRPDKGSFALSLRLQLGDLNAVLERTGQGLAPFDEPEPETFNDGNMHTYFYAWPPAATTAGKALRLAASIPLLFKPNRTLRICAEYLRHQLNAIDQPESTLAHLKPDELVAAAQPQGIGRYSPDNFIGRRLLGMIAQPNREPELEEQLRVQSSISANEAFLALLLYDREHGELPATLDALVPDYLPAVPRDYFDGQPIRYSREFRVVWSVGTDHFNVIGTGLSPEEIQNHICLPLDFAAPPASPVPNGR